MGPASTFYRISEPATTLEISPRLLALIPAAAAINLVVGTIVKELALPIYLDTIGTAVTAVLMGAVAGAIVGTTSQLLMGLLTGYQYLPFVVIQWLLAALVARLARHGMLAGPLRSTTSALLVGIACGLASAVISYTLFRGATGGGTAWLAAALRSTGMSLPWAVAISSSSADVADKGIVILLTAALIAALPRRVRARFPLAERAVAS